jgi:hypothetical protein
MHDSEPMEEAFISDVAGATSSASNGGSSLQTKNKTPNEVSPEERTAAVVESR